jgi:hypothetical protein
MKHIFDADVSVNVHFLPVPGMTYYKSLGYNVSDYKVAYDNYDLFELYFISNKLNIILDLGEDDINVLTTLIDHKKQSLKGIETSFIWKWVHSNDEAEKERLINDFVEINYKQYKK